MHTHILPLYICTTATHPTDMRTSYYYSTWKYCAMCPHTTTVYVSMKGGRIGRALYRFTSTKVQIPHIDGASWVTRVLVFYDVSSYYYCHFTTSKKFTWKLLLESRKIIECLVRIHFRTYTPPPWMRINQHTSASACIRTSPRPECGHIYSSTMTRP
jgi:hypothetical protein